MDANDSSDQVESVDLGLVEESDSAEMEVRHPASGAGMGIFFILAGPEHPLRRAHRFNAQRENRKRLARNKGSVGRAFSDSDPEDEEGRVIDYLVLCTLGWRRLIMNGRPVEYSKDAARSIYTDPKRAYVRRQVLEFLEDADNFIASSPTR